VSQGKQVVRRVVEEMWNRGDAEAIEELIHEDLVEHGAFGGEAGGRADAERTVIGFRAAFPDLRLEIADLVGEGEHVVLRWSGAGTHRAPFMGAAPSGNRVEIEGIDIYRVVDGKVVEHWGYPDVLALMKQLGGPPTTTG
jgi:steroid delta-isomerase-like uncharacterized protein